MATNVTIGLLALQGAYLEHANAFRRLPNPPVVVEVRNRTDLENPALDALLIPGGESTTMALVAERSGILEPLRTWVASGKPVWGTCAGMIMVAKHALKAKDGQTLLGVLDVQVSRNHFGSQINSFETELSVPILGDKPFPAVFIRAPVITDVGPSVEVLARLPDRAATEPSIVAVRQGPLLATAFHPELTGDTRFHQYFVDVVRKSKGVAPPL